MNDDQAASWISRKRRWLWMGGLALGVGTFSIGLVSEAPATLIAGRMPIDTPTYQLAGKLREGRLVTGDGQELVWNLKLLRTLASAQVSGVWTFNSADAAITGDVSLANGVTLSAVEGRMGSHFLTSFAPGLGGNCVFTAEISADRVVISTSTLDVDGGFTTNPGACNARDLPGLTGTANGEDGLAVIRVRATDASPDDPPLAVARLAADASGRIDLTAEGAEVLAGRKASGPSSIELLK